MRIEFRIFISRVCTSASSIRLSILTVQISSECVCECHWQIDGYRVKGTKQKRTIVRTVYDDVADNTANIGYPHFVCETAVFILKFSPIFTCTKWHKFTEEETLRIIDVNRFILFVFGSRKHSKSQRCVKNRQITKFFVSKLDKCVYFGIDAALHLYSIA